MSMNFTRRDFIKGGISAFTIGFAAPAFLADLARAQSGNRTLVVLYLSGGNDALSTLVPYQDPFYYSRRPTQAIAANSVLQLGADSAGRSLGLHPKLTGLKTLFTQGNVAVIQRTGYQNSSRSHFLGTDIWSTANPANSLGPGWLGRYLDTLPSPIDPFAGWCTIRDVPHTLIGAKASVPAIPSPSTYALQSPNTGTEATLSKNAMTSLAGYVPSDRPHLAFVNGSVQGALNTLDKVASVASYIPTATYGTDGLSQALKAVAGAMVRGLGTKVFWVQIGGFDTHSNQGANTGGYANLMNTLNSALTAFATDLKNQSLWNNTLVVQFSEFGRRISENGSQGTDHGAGAVMFALGGSVNGGLYGTAPSLDPSPSNPTLENNGGDVHYETDFRSVYARVLDNWLAVNSTTILGGDFRKSSLTFV